MSWGIEPGSTNRPRAWPKEGSECEEETGNTFLSLFSSQGFKSPGELVPMAVRVHPFPSRTRQLSSSAPTILGWKRPGKIGRRQHRRRGRAYHGSDTLFFIMYGWEGSCVVNGFFLTYPQQEGCVEHHMPYAMCCVYRSTWHSGCVWWDVWRRDGLYISWTP